MPKLQIAWILTVLVAVAVFVMVTLPDLQMHHLRELRYDAGPVIGLNRIYHAIREYEKTAGSLPQARSKVEGSNFEVSWRVLILPHLGFRDIYERYEFDHPWDGPLNTQMAANNRQLFRAYSQNQIGEDPTLYTDFVAVTGDGTAWCTDAAVSFNQIEPIAADLLLAVQVENSGIHWMEPRDIGVEELAKLREYGTSDTDLRIGRYVLFADGVVWPISESCPGSELAKIATLEGARTYSRDSVLAKHRL